MYTLGRRTAAEARRLSETSDEPKQHEHLLFDEHFLEASGAQVVDTKRGGQYVWLSSPSVRTHTHFDSDRNSFVQLIGHKRFVLWHPNQTHSLCPFPRLHPLWHKSRADFEAPDVSEASPCANYSSTVALVVDVGPGDVLYVPPFWWHTVETLTPSLSLSNISRWPALYEHLNAIYRYDYLWDELKE